MIRVHASASLDIDLCDEQLKARVKIAGGTTTKMSFVLATPPQYETR